jgi:hypothetical protein
MWAVEEYNVLYLKYTYGELISLIRKSDISFGAYENDLILITFYSSDSVLNPHARVPSTIVLNYKDCTTPVCNTRDELLIVLNTILESQSVIKVDKAGTFIGQADTLNFIEGSNVTLTVTNDTVNNKIDIMIAASGGGGGLPPDGTYGDIVVSSSGTVWTVTDDTSNQQVAVYEDTFLRGTRPALNFYDDGGPVSVIATDDPINNRVDIEITSNITGFVTGVSATGPITSSGGTTPTISTSMSTSRLIGRTTAGTGVMEEISVGSGLSLSGTTLSATTQVVGYEMNFLLMGG